MSRLSSAKRLTRADVLVLGVVGLLLGVLVPVLLARPRAQATRVLCRANLGQIGKMMFIYAQDYNGALPRVDGPTTVWGLVVNWLAPDRYGAYGINRTDNSGGTASISSCFYLLVKHYAAPPRLFVCKGDVGAVEFRLADPSPGVFPIKLADAWDFGPGLDATKYCSYSYHIPFGRFPLMTGRDPNLAVAADRNPWIRSPGADAKTNFAVFKPDMAPWRGTPEQARVGNALTHQEDGQNVLFLDGRVTFEKRAFCAVDKDSIYTLSDRIATNQGSALGIQPVPSPDLSAPCEQDSLLLHDTDLHGVAPRPPQRRLSNSGAGTPR